jgi:hypothetical protein
MFVSSNFEITVPHCSAHYTPNGTGYVLDTVALDPDHLPILFRILDKLEGENLLVQVENLDKELLQSLSSELITPNVGIRFCKIPHKRANQRQHLQIVVP